MATGKSNVEIDPTKISIEVGDFKILKSPKKPLTENLTKINEYLKQKEIEITVNIGEGKFEWTIFTCDLTHEYISINKDYRTWKSLLL